MAKRQAKKTLLIVGEGYDEVAFLNHVKQFPGVCGQGVKITIKNARGKGALHVIDTAIGQTKAATYDRIAVLLDTDTDWNEKTAKLARTKGIQVIKADPCLEALLLRAIGQRPGTASQLKKQFAPFVADAATLPASYARHFGVDVLQTARQQEMAINELLTLLGI